MSSGQRIQQQPALLLHHRPFRDSSLLLDLFTRDHGRLVLVARGARGAKSRWRGVLRPFMPLSVCWWLRSDLGTLTGAEIDGKPISLSGDCLLSGYYLNELILNFLHRHDPQPEIFTAYSQTIDSLAASQDPAPSLRHFEMELLRLLGYGLLFEHESGSEAVLEPAANYDYRPEQGPVRVSRDAGNMVFTGAALIGIREQRFADSAILQDAGRLLRQLIAFHLGGKELKSRKVLVELRRRRDTLSRTEDT
jgi:DNA repair protein RecO (recombination protein O)